LGLIGLPLLCIAVVWEGGLALPRLWILHKGAVLAMELAEHAERGAGLDLAAALPPTTGVTGALAAVADGAETRLDQMVLGRMTCLGRRRDGSDWWVDGEDGGHDEVCRLRCRSGRPVGWGCGRLANQRPGCLSSGDKASQDFTSRDE
jgi:hypothetical protein